MIEEDTIDEVDSEIIEAVEEEVLEEKQEKKVRKKRTPRPKKVVQEEEYDDDYDDFYVEEDDIITTTTDGVIKIKIKKQEKPEAPRRATYYLKQETIRKIEKVSKMSGIGKSKLVQLLLDQALDNLEIEK